MYGDMEKAWGLVWRTYWTFNWMYREK